MQRLFGCYLGYGHEGQNVRQGATYCKHYINLPIREDALDVSLTGSNCGSLCTKLGANKGKNESDKEERRQRQ